LKRKYLLSLFLVVQILALQILKFLPEAVEKYYSNGLYVWISKFSRIVLGKIPFSVGDVMYCVLILLAFRWFFKSWKNWKLYWKDNLLRIVNVISIGYFLFHLLWAVNYYRVPLYEKMSIQKEYSEADLVAFTKKLIVKTNEIHSQIVKNDSLKVSIPYSQEQIFEMNVNGYSGLGDQYSFFAYENSSVKKSLISFPLTYMGFAGYLNPFTNEAQVNYMIPMYNFPFTSCHEMAHQIGYASESECNFIAFLATTKNENLYFKYSGYVSALKYCLNTLEKIEEGKSKPFKKSVHSGIVKNFQESKDFWEEHQTFIDNGFEFFYDNFLKLNQQKDGMESYSKFVDLMVNYYKDKNL